MKTSSVSLKSILSTSGLVLSLISSSFKTSSGSSSKNIIFSISRRLHISFLKPNSNWNREGKKSCWIYFSPVVETLYSFGFEEDVFHISGLVTLTIGWWIVNIPETCPRETVLSVLNKEDVGQDREGARRKYRRAPISWPVIPDIANISTNITCFI